MPLSHHIEITNPDNILSSGESLGYDWLVINNGIGFRCGYVLIPHGHPWFEFGCDDITPRPEVHGGLTYANYGASGGSGELKKDMSEWLIGFDCAHAGDAPDPSLERRNTTRFPEEYFRIMGHANSIRSTEYVESELGHLCTQVFIAGLGV